MSLHILKIILMVRNFFSDNNFDRIRLYIFLFKKMYLGFTNFSFIRPVNMHDALVNVTCPDYLKNKPNLFGQSLSLFLYIYLSFHFAF